MTAITSPRIRRLGLGALGCCLAVAAAPALATGPHPVTTPTDLAIAKTSDRGSYQPGEVIAYTITVTNAGRTSVRQSDIRVDDPQLPGLALAGTGAKDGRLDPGEHVVYNGARTAAVEDCGRLANTASVGLRTGAKGVAADADSSNDFATHWVDVAGEACAPAPAVIGLARPQPAPAPSGIQEAFPQSEAACPLPRLGARVTGPRTLVAGQLARFTIQVRNGRGSAAARRTRLSVRLPSGFALATPVEASALRGGAMRWTLGTLAPRRAASISLTLRADRATSGSRALSAAVSSACGSARATARVRVAQAVETQARPAVTG